MKDITTHLIVHKQVAAEATPAGDRRFKFVVTTDAPDRERDVVSARGIVLDAFLKNSIIPWAHDYRSLPVGRAVDVEVSDHGIQMVIEFATADMNPMAEQVYRMVKAGFIKATSIGFKPLEWVYDEARRGTNFLKVELLEVSIVPIPANAQALIAASAAGIDTSVLKGWAEQTLKALRQAPDLGELHLDHTGADQAETTKTGDQYRTFASWPSRWNRTLSKAFDVAHEEFPARSVEQAMVAKYCECAVKTLHFRQEQIPSTRVGSFLAALGEVLSQASVDDVRNLTRDGQEEPPEYERIQLSSRDEREFLVDGLRFLQWEGNRIGLNVEPRWYGIEATLYAGRVQRDGAEAFFGKVMARARELNFLKGEAFALSGEFLPRGTESYDDLILDAGNAGAVRRIATLLTEQGAAMENRGALLCGPPGTGKTLAGRILMNKAPATFIWVSSRDFYYAGAFGGLAHAFELARECAPTVLFIEDVDNWLTPTAVDLLKTEMDGIAQSRGVVTILTTNYPEYLPKALIDRPGRFHDVLRFDLPNDEARALMLRKWLPEISEADVAATATATAGYSGAHIRELARFATIIAAQDGVVLPEAVRLALVKLAEQRDLITAVQAQGSRYRAPAGIVGKAPSVGATGLSPVDPAYTSVAALARLYGAAGGANVAALASAIDGVALPQDRDPVGWKAYQKAAMRAQRKAGETPLADAVLADLLADYGFDEEAAMLKGDALVPVPEKAMEPDMAMSAAVMSACEACIEACAECVATCAKLPDVPEAVTCASECQACLASCGACISALAAGDAIAAMAACADACTACAAACAACAAACARQADRPEAAACMGECQECQGTCLSCVTACSGVAPAGDGTSMDIGEMTSHGAIVKAGRVLSKANETRLQEASGAMAHAKDQIDTVLKTAGREEPGAVEENAARDLVVTFVEDEPAESYALMLTEEPDLTRAAEPALEMVDAELVRDVVRRALGELVSAQTTRTINALRGRID